MNKRICFILFPIFALLFSNYSMGDNSVFISQKHLGLSITHTTVQNKLPFSTDLRKEEKKINKNAIRIKAWDDAFIVNIPTHWEPVIPTVHYTKATYSPYRFEVLDIPLPAYNLRGPPSVI